MNHIHRLIAEPHGGSPLHATASEAFDLQKQLGVPVLIEHNGRRYSVGLEIKQVSGPPMPEDTGR